MTGLLDSCENYFGTRNLYDILNIEKSASDIEVRKAYKKLSLVVHPDRVSDDEKVGATEKFKVLGKIHSILSDREKRATYDETGIIDDGDECEFEDRDWYEYWRLLFKISEVDIENYSKEYKDSDEEKADLKHSYLKGKGDMDFIFDHVPFLELSEEERIRNIIENMIASGEVPSYDSFTNESPRKKQRRKRKLEKEAKEAEQVRKELLKKKQKCSKKSGKDNVEEELVESDLLRAMILQRKERETQADSFFQHLEAKYGGNKNTKKGKGKGKK